MVKYRKTYRRNNKKTYSKKRKTRRSRPYSKKNKTSKKRKYTRQSGGAGADVSETQAETQAKLEDIKKETVEWVGKYKKDVTERFALLAATAAAAGEEKKKLSEENKQLSEENKLLKEGSGDSPRDGSGDEALREENTKLKTEMEEYKSARSWARGELNSRQQKITARYNELRACQAENETTKQALSLARAEWRRAETESAECQKATKVTLTEAALERSNHEEKHADYLKEFESRKEHQKLAYECSEREKAKEAKEAKEANEVRDKGN